MAPFLRRGVGAVVKIQLASADALPADRRLAEAARGGGDRREALSTRTALLVCLIAGLVPIWAVTRFPSVDGPIHLYIVYVLDQLAQPGANVFDRVFVRNYHIEPNLTAYGILWLFSRGFPPLVAEKLFLSSYLVLFAGSASYLMRSFGRSNAVLALLTMPLALGWFMHAGLYNFVLSQAIFLLACGYTIQHAERLGWRQLLVLSLLMLVLALTHLVGIGVFLLYLGLYRTGLALRNALNSSGEQRWKDAGLPLIVDAGQLLLASLPALAIVASFIVRRVLSDGATAPAMSIIQKIWYVTSISPIFSVDKREAIALAPFVAVFWALALKLALKLWQDKKLRVEAIPVLLPPALLTMVLTAGSLGFAGFDALPRLLPFAFFSLIITFGMLRLGSAWRAAITLSVVGGLCATAVIHYFFYRQINTLYEDYAAARTPQPPGSAVVEFHVWAPKSEIAGRTSGWRLDATHYFRGSFARENGLVLLNTKLLSPYVWGYFPVQYRKSGGLVTASYDAETFRSPVAPMLEFERSVGVPIREVAFWPATDGPTESEWIVPTREVLLRRELASRWRLSPRTSNVAPFVYLPKAAPSDAPLGLQQR